MIENFHHHHTVNKSPAKKNNDYSTATATTSKTTFPKTTPSKPAFLPKITKKRLTEETMSPHLRDMEYAVRGTVVIAADKINDELQKYIDSKLS